MTPQMLSRELFRIATALDNSSSPSRKLVLNDLNDLLFKVATEDHAAGGVTDSIIDTMKELGLATAVGGGIALIGGGVIQHRNLKDTTNAVNQVMSAPENKDLGPKDIIFNTLNAINYGKEGDISSKNVMSCINDIGVQPASLEEWKACFVYELLHEGALLKAEGPYFITGKNAKVDPHLNYMP